MTELPRQVDAAGRNGAESATPAADILPILRWHLDRYDRLRASTASRAGVVLSAGAILSAGNAVVLAQIFGGGLAQLSPGLIAAFAIGVLADAVLVVLALLNAANVLVTPRSSSEMFTEGQALPPSLLFNGTYTAAAAPTYEMFHAAVAAQQGTDQVEAAEVELYVNIRQHRHRYRRLRAAVRLLRWAAVLFLVVLATGVVADLAARF